jgi:hypothetical protein
MTKFSALHFHSLPNAAHYSFFKERFSPALSAAGADVKTAFAALMPSFSDWLAKESALIEWQRASEYTQQIADADHDVDFDLAGMKAQVHAALYSIHPDIVAAAHRIDLMMKNYGDLMHKPYETEVGDVEAIIARLRGDLASDVTKVNIAGWVDKLQSDFATFNALFNARNAQRVKKPASSFREVRQGLEGVYHQMTAIADSSALLGLSTQFATFINGINPEIEYLNARYHTAKTDLSDCQPEPIPAQTYTGLAITPTPRVFLVTSKGTVELRLGADFYFEYKNNIEAGNADCVVKAKGSYKGTKTVTFIISR